MALAILDNILGPILSLNPLLAILLISFVISLVTLLAYKFLTNQSLMKDLRNEINDLQKEAKELKNHPEKAMKVQTRMMETNMRYMSESMKPTLFTFLPILIVFAWLNSHMTYYPLYPNVPFDVTAAFNKGVTGDATLSVPEGLKVIDATTKPIVNSEAAWYVQGGDGTYNVTVNYNGVSAGKQLIVTSQRKYIEPIQNYKNSPIKAVTVGNQRVHPFGDISVFGWQPGWLGTYIIFSLAFSLGLRRLLKIY